MEEKNTKAQSADCERLFEAVERGAVGKANKLLSRGEVSADCRDNKGRTPLIVASGAGNASMAGAILSHNPDVNAADEDGNTAVTTAALHGHLDMVRLLIPHGAKAEIPNNEGVNALDILKDKAPDIIASYQASPPVIVDAETETNQNDAGTVTDDTAPEETAPLEEVPEQAGAADLDDGAEDSLDAEGTDGFPDEPEVRSTSEPTVAAAAAQEPIASPPAFLIDPEDAASLAELSSKFFGRPRPESLSRPISLDEMRQMIDATDRESDAMQKSTGRVLSAQAGFRPDLLKDLRGIKDWRPDMGTIGRWKLAGDMAMEAEEAGIDPGPASTYQLHACHKAPTKEQRIMVLKAALEECLSVRDINKRVAPMVRKAKMAASGQLEQMGSLAAEIIEALEDPEALLRHPEKSVFLQDGEKLANEFKFSELSRIHEKAGEVETKRAKQKRALEEKAESFSPVISFLRLIKRTISGACEGNSD